jgi:hypothetical protein
LYIRPGRSSAGGPAAGPFLFNGIQWSNKKKFNGQMRRKKSSKSESWTAMLLPWLRLA